MRVDFLVETVKNASTHTIHFVIKLDRFAEPPSTGWEAGRWGAASDHTRETHASHVKVEPGEAFRRRKTRQIQTDG